MKLYFSVFNLNENSNLYPLFFYKVTDEDFTLNAFAEYNDFYKHKFQEVEYKDFYKIHDSFNKWLDKLQELSIENKKLTEWLAYENITLWQFIKENLSWNQRHNVVIIEVLLNIIKNNSVSEIVYYTNIYSNSIPCVKRICDLNGKIFSLFKAKHLVNDQVDLKKNEWTYKLNNGKRTEIKNYIKMNRQREFGSGRVLFFNVRDSEYFENKVLKDNYIHSFFEYFISKGQKSYRVVLPIYPKDRKMFIDKHFGDSYYENIFFDEFLQEDKVDISDRWLKHFQKIWQMLYLHVEFQKAFTWKGINLVDVYYEYMKKQFTSYLVFRVIVSLKSAQAMLLKLKPSRIFLTNEAFDVSRAIIIEAKRIGIETIGLQHGVIAKQHWYYLDANTSSTPEIDIEPFYGFIIPDKTFVFGQYFKNILSYEGTYNPENIYVLPNWIMQNKAEGNLLTKEELLTIYNITNKIILILSGVFLDNSLEYILDKHKNENCTFIIKLHPSESLFDKIEYVLKKSKSKYVITKEHYSEFILYSECIYSLLLSTSVLDIALLGKKPYVYRKYDIIEEYPWEDLTYSLEDYSVSSTLTIEDKKKLSSICYMDTKEKLFQKLDKILWS